MSGWQTFWIVFAILLAAPSTRGIVTALEALTAEVRQLRADLRVWGGR